MSTLCNTTKKKSYKILTLVGRAFRWNRSCLYLQQQPRVHNQKQLESIKQLNRRFSINANGNLYDNYSSIRLSSNQTFYTTLNLNAISGLGSGYISNTLLYRIPQFYSRRQHYSIFHKYKKVMDAPAGLFRGSVDRFNGITVESAAEYENDLDFAVKLKKSLTYWAEIKRRGIWFKVQTEHSDWIPHLAKEGFEFHHAKSGFVVMYRWLPENESANIPVYAHTMVGVGGLVINDKEEVLVVSDRYAMIPGSWKLPGGYVEPRENIIDAAKREVLEETGVDCTFKTLVSIRHTHGVGFDCSDFYVVVALKPKQLDLTRCDREILKCEWMPITDFLKHPNVHETNRHFMRTYLEYRKNNIQFACEVGNHQVLKKEYRLYFMQSVEDKDKINEQQKNPSKE